MTYRGVGAGPGPVKTYRVDMPFPWGKDTEIVAPVDQMVNDTWNALSPRISELESRIIQDMEDELSVEGPRLVRQVLTESVVPVMNTQMEAAFAQVEDIKADVQKSVIIVGLTIVAAMGFGAWWIKKG